ncbi:hypothetical protein BGM30_18070 [Microcystis aeruginosa NIES-298]|uniref:Uncharacterized protein n=1 Tax=Microcystis aeruginosa NIES-298 TaxID=449468 RepID=A0A9P2YIY7_MICAE|nr:hypothetical protein BGM30_18070 [Microcystis aeruginosa NIES-298]
MDFKFDPPLVPRVDSFKLSIADFESINLIEDSQVYLFRLFVTWYGSIGGHKSTKSLSGKRLN